MPPQGAPQRRARKRQCWPDCSRRGAPPYPALASLAK
jgi:hypothetical protein